MVALDNDSNPPKGSIALRGFRFDLGADELLDDAGEHVSLRPQCLGVLRCLARSAGRVVAKEDLIREVWPNLMVTDDSLVQCIGDLRRALGDERHRLLQTEPRRGYRLVPSLPSASEPSADAQCSQEVRFATSADGVRIAYVCMGEGVPVVRAARPISHIGYDIDCLTEGPILRAVARGHRLIRFDQRGQGLSDRDVDAGTLEDWVRDLQAVVDAEELSRFVLWSISGGVSSAIRFAALHPDRVERLILSAGWARGPAMRGIPGWDARGAAWLRLVERLWDNPNSNIRVGLDANGGTHQYPGATMEQVRSYDRLLMHSCSPASAAAAHRVAAHVDSSADLGRIRCPTLVTHSRGDRVTPFDEVRLLAAGIPCARLVTLDSPNHMPLPQEPAFDELVRLIDDFIGEGDAGVHRPGLRTVSEAARAPALRMVERRPNGKGVANR